MIPEYLTLKEAAEYIHHKCGERVTPRWLLELAENEELQLFAWVLKDVCVMPEPLPIYSPHPCKAEIRHDFDMAKRIVYEAGTYVLLDVKALMLIQRAQALPDPITIKDLVIGGKKYDIAGEPFVSFGKVMALPGQWGIYADDLRFRTEDINRLIEASKQPTIIPGAPAAKVEAGADTTPPPDTNEEVHTGLDGAPYLQKGKNTRDKVDAWVKFQAKKMLEDGDIASDLVARIYLEANKWGYQSERTNKGETISKATITKLLPAKVTGGRGKNRGKSKK